MATTKDVGLWQLKLILTRSSAKSEKNDAYA